MVATVYPTAAGNWSTRTWFDDSTGAAYVNGTPQVGDTVLLNNLVITMDINIHIASLRSTAGTHAAGGTAGQLFCSANGLTLLIDNDMTAGSSLALNCMHIAGNSITVGGANLTIFGSTTATATQTIKLGGAGTVNLTANIIGGSQSASVAVVNATTGTINVTGNITGGAGASASGLTNTTGTIAVIGVVTGGSAAGSHGVASSGAGPISLSTVTGGSISGAYGFNNTSTAPVTISTALNGGSAAGAYGLMNGTSATGGNVIVNGTTNASSTCPAASDFVTGTGIIEFVGNVINNAAIAAVNASRVCFGPNCQITVAKPGVLPATSGTQTMQVGGFMPIGEGSIA